MKLDYEGVLMMRVLRVKMQAAVAAHNAGVLNDEGLMLLNIQTHNALRELADRASG